jgi:hypothetical protein
LPSLVTDFFARNPGNPHYGLKVLLVWLLVALFVVVWGSRQRGPRGVTSGGGGEAFASMRANTTRGWMWRLAFLGLAGLYAFLILYGSNFADHDHDFLTLFSVRGEMLSPLIWPGEGRFFPLGQQEFNVLQLVTRSCPGYHSFAIAELLALLACLYILLDDLTVPWRLGVTAALLVVPSFLISFTGLIFPERNVLFALVLMAFCVRQYDRSGSRAHLVGALLAAHWALYCKETTSVFLIGFAGARLYLSWVRRRPSTRESLAGLCTENRVELGLLALTTVFAVLYAIVMLPSASLGYAQTHGTHSSLLSLLAAYLRSDLLVGVFVLVATTRLLRGLRRPERVDSLWDPLALGGLGWLAAFLFLRLQGPYYLAPVDLVAVLYLGRLLARAAPPSLVPVAVAVLLTLQNLMGSAYHLIERKNIMQAKEGMARRIVELALANGEEPLALFFPHARGYHIMGFGAFLSHLGLEIEGARSTRGAGAPSVVLGSPREFPRGLCDEHRYQIPCVQQGGPPPGALVVHLPDDAPEPGTVEGSVETSRVVFTYRPFLVSVEAVPFFDRLRGVSLTFRTSPLPPTWLTARILRAEPGAGEPPDGRPEGRAPGHRPQSRRAAP